ncbi:MAG: peptide-methionine (S)-S-oxide reductase, partial [Saprospiraceae bacterium]
MKINKVLFFLMISIGITSSCESQKSTDHKPVTKSPDQTIPNDMKTEIATFGAGCFWCVEAVFQELKGVMKVESGYMGGTLPNP